MVAVAVDTAGQKSAHVGQGRARTETCAVERARFRIRRDVKDGGLSAG